MDKEEKWIQIINYEGLYEISTRFRIRSLDRNIKNGINTRFKKSCIIKMCITKGYLCVNLTKNKITKKFYIHRLIAQHFIPNPDNLEFIDHINGNKSDNRIENLQWITKRDNLIKSHYIDSINKPKNSRSIKPIIQYNLSGDFVAEHRSISEAQNIFTPDKKGKGIICNLTAPHRQKSAYGYIWKYKQ